MPKHRKPKSEKERMEMLQRFQKEDPTWDYLGADAALKRKKEELDELLSAPVEKRFQGGSYLFDEIVAREKAEKQLSHVHVSNVERGQDLDKRYSEYFNDSKNRSSIQREIQQWVRRQHHPSMKDYWRNQKKGAKSKDSSEQ